MGGGVSGGIASLRKGLDSRIVSRSTVGSCPTGAAMDVAGATTAVEHSAKSH